MNEREKMNRLNLKKTLAVMMLLFFATSASAAKIIYKSFDTGFSSQPNGIPDGGYAIYLTGSIQQQDLQEFKSTLHKLSQTVKADKGSPLERILVLDSAGGDVATALRIGRIIRINQMNVAVPDSAKCLSSCVFLLAAGVIKYPWGDVGIHRPYFEAKPAQGYDQALKEVLNASRNYFREMNIPEQLADDMFSIPPVEMRLLGDTQLSRYRLNQDDMAYAEDSAIKNAQAYGLTRQEYERRQKLSEIYSKECRSLNSEEANKNPTGVAIKCGELGRQRAGLILK
jgi:hypothetical protein